MKRIISLSLILMLMAWMCTACSVEDNQETGKSKIVTTNFAEYDWVRNITGSTEKFEITMLGGGVDMHSYQPTATDIITISDCDMFVYVGGESDTWVTDVLDGKRNENMEIITLMEILGENAKTEEHVEGMQEESEEESEEEYDEHVWLSLRNAVEFCNQIEKSLEKIDPDNKTVYESNLKSYTQKLSELDEKYTEAVKNAKTKTLMFGDRFPFRYMTDDYGLEYYAVFAGCSAETEASFETITFLAHKADELSLNCVITIDGSDKKIAETIIENTKTKSQKILTLDSMQSVTMTDIENGEMYLSVMEQNLSVLSQALN